MNSKITIPLIIIALLGVFFLGKGIIGYVIAQSCCFPPDCDPENMCDIAKPELESPLSSQSLLYVYVGWVLVSISIAAYIILRRKNTI